MTAEDETPGTLKSFQSGANRQNSELERRGKDLGVGGRARGKVASSAGDVPSLRCLQGFREGPLKAGGSWNVRLKGGVGWEVSSEDTPEEGWPLAHQRLPEQRTGRRVGLEEPREINTSMELPAERTARKAGGQRGEDRARDAEAAPGAGRPPERRLGVRGGQCAEPRTTVRGAGSERSLLVGGAKACRTCPAHFLLLCPPRLTSWAHSHLPPLHCGSLTTGLSPDLPIFWVHTQKN